MTKPYQYDTPFKALSDSELNHLCEISDDAYTGTAKGLRNKLREERLRREPQALELTGFELQIIYDALDSQWECEREDKDNDESDTGNLMAKIADSISDAGLRHQA